MRSRLLALPSLVALLLAVGASAASAAQTSGQSATNGQGAFSTASSVQSHPSNIVVPIRILSPGDGGSVSQSNSSSASSQAANTNTTTQIAGQVTSGLGLGAVQAAGQEAHNGQIAGSGAESSQQSPANVAVPIRILSPGSDGSTSQSNSSSAGSTASNENHTTQGVIQSDPSGGDPTQASGQLSDSGQGAGSFAGSTQSDPTNRAVPIRILSPGDGGSVSQSNSSSASSQAANTNTTTQIAGQVTSGLGLGAVQAAGQEAHNGQIAGSGAESSQQSPANVAVPIRILSPGSDGSTSQSNSSSAGSTASNNNATTQLVTAALSGGLILV